MRSTQSFVGLATLSAAISTAAGQILSSPTSLRSNISLTSLRPSASPIPTGSFCCDLFADGVGLNFWWNQTATAYTATVITRYIEYNNTVATELATVTNVNATSGNIPTNIVGSWNEYRRTTVGTQTVASYETTAIASPTPHLVFGMFMYFTGTWAMNTQGTKTCDAIGGPVDRIHLPTPYIYVEDPPVTRTDQAFLPPPPSDIMESAILQNPSLLKKFPRFTDCEIVTGTGQPTVHIPVTALTSHTSTTIRRTGAAPAPTTTSGNRLTQESKTTELPTSTTETSLADTTPPKDEPTSAPNSPTTPSTTQTPPVLGPTSAASIPSGNVVIPSWTGNIQPPVESDRSLSLPTDPAPPPAGPVTTSNKPSLPFPITPVPEPTTTNLDGSPATTINSGAVILPGDRTLNPGQATTISGIAISVPSDKPATSGFSPPLIIIDSSTASTADSTRLIVIDGTTIAIPNPTSIPAQAPAVPITIGSQVLTIHAPTASGDSDSIGIVLPNSETLAIGAMTTYAGQTLVASVVTSGTVVATVVEVLGESTTQSVTLPAATGPSGSASSSETRGSSTETGADAPEFTGGTGTRLGGMNAWGLFNAVGIALLACA